MRSSRVLALCLGLFAANAGAQSTTDYDDDNDNLIDIRTLAQLNAVRYDLDGNGTVSASDRTNYTAAFTTPATGMGCASTCTGYELRQNLDFDVDGDNDVDSSDTGSYPNWSPIGGTYSATFEGNGFTISHLTIVDASGNAGLFNAVSGTVRNLGVADANVSTVASSSYYAGTLAAQISGGTVISSWTSGQVRAGTGAGIRAATGGVVGRLTGSNARLAASYSTANVRGSGDSSQYVGGLTGGVYNGPKIVACYATGAVNGGGSSYAGGLIGNNQGPSEVRASYFAGTVTNAGTAQGVTAENDGSDEDYYDVYFDAGTTGLSGGQSTANLQRPTDASGIYANWDDLDVNGNGSANEDPWHFGQSNQHPVLNYGALSAATQFAEQLVGQTDTAPSYSGISVSDKDFRRGIAIGSFVIPPPTGGNGTYDYTVTGLPTGLVFDEDGSGTCMAARTVCGTPSVVGAATVTVTVADADTNVATTDRATLTFSVAVTEGRLIVSPNRLSLAEGGSGTYTVVLSAVPTGPVTVGVSSDNPAVTVGASSLTFTTQNWNTAQSVTVTAAGDADAVDEAATIANAASGGSYTASAFVRVGVSDDERTGTDYDADNDGLIDVDSLAKLNAMRWDLDGDGAPSSGNAADYAAAFPGRTADMGCPDGPDANQLADACGGYALTADLDFDTDDDGDVDADDDFASWTPVVGWATTFDGRGHTISNLTVTGSGDDRGLFATATTAATVRALGLLDVSVTGAGVRLGALAGVFNGRVAAVYATGVVRGAGGVAGLVAEMQSTSARIVASYSTVAVECTSNQNWARAGGLAARNDGTITTSYAAGAITGDCPANRRGGLVSTSSGTVTASYWDAGLTGIADDTDSASPEGLSSSAMWTPTAYGASASDVYNAWDDQDLDGDGAVDADPWHFGTALNHPVLKWGGLDPADQRTDYDADGDRLIEISTLAQLDAVRWDLDGDGAPSSGNESGYFGAFFNPVFNPSGVGFCAPTEDDADDNDCLGYELANDLDFDTDGSGSTHTNGAGDSDDAYYNADDGWVPIGPNETPGAATHYRARFDGNGRVIDNLFVKRSRNYSGLFSALSDAALVTSLGLPDAYVGDGQGTVGMLAGLSRGRVAAVWSSGSVTARGNVGGLVGAAQATSTVVASYSTATVVCTQAGAYRAAGGLVGANGASSTIATSYSTGTVTGPCGLRRAFAYNEGTVAASYWDTTLSGIMDDTENPPQPPEGRTTAVLQAPTDYDTLVGDPDEAIYAAWDDQDVDGDGATGDDDDADPWDFGPSNQHPILKYRGLAAAPQLDAQPDTAPMFATSTLGAAVFQKDVAIQAFQVPAATGGNGVLSYAESGLPTGLVFDADGTGSCAGNAPRAVCGTPTATTTAPVTVTITVRDADGTVGATDEDELTFTVEVVVPSASIASPAALGEAALHNATVTVGLANTTFEGGVPAGSFALAIDPPLAGLSVGSVAPVSVGDTSAVLTLSYAGGNFDTVRTLSVTVPDSAHALVGALTTPTVNVVPTPSVSVSRTNLALTEGGASSTYAVVLGGQPTGTVTVRATSSDTDVARVDTDGTTPGLQNTLTFTPQNWNTARTVTVEPRDDDDAADESVTISHAVSPNYGATAASVGVTVADDETAALVIDADPATANVADAGPVALTEGAATSTPYTVKLSSLPTGTVTVAVASSDADAATVDTDAATGLQSELTFTTGNWDTAQTAWLTPVDDDDPNNEEVEILHTASNGGYDSVEARLLATVADSDVGVVVDTDPDTPGDQLTALALREGQTRTYTVRLSTLPTGGTVAVTVSSDNPAIDIAAGTSGGTFGSTANLQFNTQNWGTAQTVRVRPEEDADRVGERGTISNDPFGSGQYASAATIDIAATARDDEATGTDHDEDDDNLIEIDSLAKLDAVRWDLDGDGTPSSSTSTYLSIFAGSVLAEDMGCLDGPDVDQEGDCAGYELAADLDFDTDRDGDVDADDAYPSWAPIGGVYSGTFHGNNRSISNLTTNGAGDRGLFAELGAGSRVSNLGLADVAVTSVGSVRGRAGGLAAVVRGTVVAVHVRGGAVSITSFGNDAFAGGLAGVHAGGVVRACHATAAVSGAGYSVDVGGLAGLSQAPIAASYATGAVSGSAGSAGRFGGLVGRTDTAAAVVTNSYATGAVSGVGSSPANGGLVGQNAGGSASASYWDSDTTGRSSSALGTAQTTAGLQTPTAYGTSTDIFAAWDDHDTNDDGTVDAADDAWDFGSAYNYPALKHGGLDPASQRNDYDADSDGLIDISTVGQLHAMRWDVDGDGAPSSGNESSYFATSTFFNAVFNPSGEGFCPPTEDDADDNDCAGYELVADIDFDTDGSGAVDTNDRFSSWTPIPGWATVLDGGGHVIEHLTVSGVGDDRGLFSTATTAATVRSLGLVDVSVTGSGVRLAALAGTYNGRIAAVYSTGTVQGAGGVGGLVAEVRSASARIVASYSAVDVECTTNAGWAHNGGLAARNDGVISASYAMGRITGSCPGTVKGGLVSNSPGTEPASYWDTNLTTIGDDTDSPPQPPEGKTTAVLQAPTDYDTVVGSPGEAIYASWDDQDVDGDGETGDGGDADPWDFGLSNQHPILKYGGLAAAPQLDAQPNLVPTFGMATVANRTFQKDVAIQPFEAPAASGGNGALTYAAAGLPDGLVFDADGTGGCAGDVPRRVCGTPTAATTTTVTVTAHDADSNRMSADEATLTFTVEVVVPAAAISAPAALAEATLNGATATVALTNAAFEAGATAASFTPTTNLPGLRVASVATVNAGDTSATLTLGYSGGGFDTVRTLSVTVADSAHTLAGALTTPTVDIVPTPSVAVSRTSMTLTEGGASSTYTLVLGGQPTGAVTVTATSSDTDVARVDTDTGTPGLQNTLTFTAQNWNTAQAVTVGPRDDDDAADGMATISHAVSPNYGATAASVGVTVADDETAAIVLDADPSTATVADAGPVALAEGAAARTPYTVKLSALPTGTVTVTATSADPGLVTVDTAPATGLQSELTFTTGNWDTAQTAWLEAVDDDDPNSEEAEILHTASNGGYDGVEARLLAAVTDDDVGVIVDTDPNTPGDQLAALSLREGQTRTYTVRLSTLPAGGGNVTVAVSSANAAITATPGSLAFNAQNWATARTVTVRGEQDGDRVGEWTDIANEANGAQYGGETTTVRATAEDAEMAGADYDADGDFLIEVATLAQLDAVRWDLDGDGSPSASTSTYQGAFAGSVPGEDMGCLDGPDAGEDGDCAGYELTADLDFDTDDDGDVDADDDYPNWVPIGGTYAAAFQGNGRTIANLTTNGAGDRGLFGELGTGSSVSNLGLVDVAVTSIGSTRARAGGLAAVVRGTVAAVYVRGGTVSITSFGNDALAGGLAGVHAGGFLRACHATAAVSGAGLYIDVGGLAGLSQGAVVASYATGAVSGSGGGAGRFGGLVGRTDTAAAAITNSYATGAVSGTGSTPATGGLVGQNASGTSTASYWNSETSGQSASALGAALTTAGLQTPTSATSTFAAWGGHDTNDDGTVDAADAAWDFGSAWNYPALKYGGQDPASQRNDYDADGDGLIEISTLAQLDAVRWDLDGDGAPASGAASSYFAASGTSTFANAVFNAAGTGLACPTTTADADDNDCKGYELLNDLDFDTDGSGATHASGTGDANDAWNHGGEGWDPIGPATTVTATTHFNATFDGNGKIIDNLFVNRARDNSGLFAGLSPSAKVVALGLPDAHVRDGEDHVGVLAGQSRGRIAASWSSGAAFGDDEVGGLVGDNRGVVAASYSAAAVECGDAAGSGGGLAGVNSLAIDTSYSTGTVTGACATKAGFAPGAGVAIASYWDTGLSGIADDADDPPISPEGRTTAALQAPTDYDTVATPADGAIYAVWDDQDVDGDGATGDGDDADPWDFGRANQHPILKYRGMAAAPQLDAQPDTAPVFATSTLAAMTFPGGVAIQPFLLPAVTAGNGAYVYTPSGLPAGLSLGLPDCATARTVCGTPTAAISTTVTVTVDDGDSNQGPGDRDTVTFMVTVPAASARIVSTTPTALAETNLNGAAVTVVLSGTAFGASISPSGFQLATTPPIAGLSIASAIRASATSTTLRLRFDATDFTAQSTLSVRVRAAAHRFGGDLDTATVDVVPALGVALSATELALQEDPGTSNDNVGTYTVALTGQPAGTVTVRATSGNPDVTVDPGTLTFDGSSWNIPTFVTVTAGGDDDAVDDVAFITHAVQGIPGVASGPRVRVTVADDDSRGLTLATTTLSVAEGATATYTARLVSAPTGVVAVAIASSDGAVTVDADATALGEQATLLFNAANWNAPQTVTVRAAEDDDGEGGTATLTHDPSGADYGDVSDVAVTFAVVDNDTKGATLSASSLNVQENGAAEYTLVLDTQPVGGPVSVAVATAGTAVATAVPRTLTFTAENWKVPQTVAVSGVDDANTTDDAETIAHTPTGGGYDGVSIANVDVTAVDDDVAGLKVSPVNLTVAEGATATYTVRLNVAPTAAATVTVGGATAKLTADTDTGTTGDQTTLSFDATNWDTARTVTVAGVADADGKDESIDLTHAVTGTGNYASLAPIRRPGVTVRVTDAQTAGVVAEPTSLTIAEGGTATYEVRLTAPPASGTTTVSVAASGVAGLAVATSTLRFDAASWATAQTVTVTAVADHDRLSDAEAVLRHGVANYGAVMAGPDVRVTVRNVTMDHDADADGLIDIDSLAKLNAMRWDLDGDGTPAPTATSSYAAAFPNPRGGGVCPTPVSGVACVGYELTADLDFDTDGDGGTWTETGGVVGGDEDDDYYNGGLGWEAVGTDLATPFTGRFDGNGRIVRNLFLNYGNVRYRGLFGVVSGRLEAVGVADAWVRGDHGAGALVGFASASARVTGSWSTGAVSGDSSAGGLVGRTQTGARIAASYSTASVECRNGASGYAGGLAGGGSSGTTAVSTSWSAGAVSGACPDKAGLIGERAAATASYWDATASGIPDDGDLDAPEGLGTADLQRPTDYDGIYAAWNADLDGDGGPDDPWDFGTSSQYPSLKWDGFDATKQFAVPPPPEPETPEPETPAPETPGVVDLAPEVVSTLADLELDVGAAVHLDLGAAFRDPEGGALAYRAESSHPRVASATLSGGILAVAGLRPGEARVTATATDAGGQSASQSFAVRVGTVVSFAADASAPEGGAIRLALLASRPAPRRLEVPYVLSPAAEGASADAADHDGGAGGVAVFEEGAERTEIAIGVVDDDEVEPVRERFVAVLSAPAADAGYGLGAKPSALATIEEGVCDREAAVRDALRGTLPCAAVADLSSRSSLRLAGAGVSRLRPEDLLGLSGLRLLDLSGNALTAWPGGALEMLPNLRSLRLGGNRIGSLPESLGEQPQLADLRLPGNGLSELPPGALAGLSGLRRLDLSGNALEELPAGMFEGLAVLREVRLQDNPGAPFLLTMELVRTDAEAWAPGPASLAARVREGAPFPMQAALAEPEGVALSIPAGAVRGGPATVEQDGAPLLLARLSSAPAVPDAECERGELLRPCFDGLATAAGAPLALFKRPPTVAGLAAQALQSGGDDLRVELSQRFGSEDVLAYVAESSDESVARVRLRDGLLIVEAVGEGTATVTVVATDADGLAGTLRFEVRATELLRSQWRGWRIVLLERASDDR